MPTLGSPSITCGSAYAEVLAKLSSAQNDVIQLTDAERTLFVEAVAPLVAEQRDASGALFSYFG